MRPPAAGGGAIGSFFVVAARFAVAAETFAVGAFRVGAVLLVTGFVTIVVPALVALSSLSRLLPPGAVDCAVAGRFVCLLCARKVDVALWRVVVFAGLEFLAADICLFSPNVDFNGDRGRTR